MTSMSTITAFATAHDAATFTDKDGFVAIQARLYDDDGRRTVQHAPDGCDFHRVSAWNTAITENPSLAMRWIA